MLLPGPVPESWWGHGSIQRVDLETGEVTTLYTECDGHPLRAPNDLVFDDTGGFWFTDHGVRLERSSDLTGVYYAQPDGSRDHRGAVPARGTQRRRAVAGSGPALRGRDPHRSGVDMARAVARHARPWGCRSTPAARCCTVRPACSCSTRSPSTARAGCASATLGHRWDHGDLARRERGRVHAHRRPDRHQHLLRRRRPAHGVRHLLRDRSAPAGDLARGPASRFAFGD